MLNRVRYTDNETDKFFQSKCIISISSPSLIALAVGGLLIKKKEERKKSKEKKSKKKGLPMLFHGSI